MDGDGSGRNTHLSFFLTIMRGEYDALLQWPFKQDSHPDAARSRQSFRLEPTSSSFQRPQK